jgi:hypothetical protein
LYIALQDNVGVRSGSSREEGAALVIALLAVVVMTMLGFVLMSILRGGLVQAVATEAGIQAEAIAQKGLDDTLALFRGAVAQGQGAGADYRAKVAMVESKLTQAAAFLDADAGDGANDNDGQIVAADRGHYRIDIISDEVKMNPEKPPAKPVTNPDFPYVRKFVVRSRGTIDGKPATVVTKQMTVYVSSINPVFRYPVSSRQNLVMNGAPYVVGDVLVRGGNFQAGDEAFFVGSAGSKYGIQTGLPAIRGFMRVDGGGGGPKYSLRMLDGTVASGDTLDPGYFTADYFPLEDTSLDNDVMVDAAAYVSDKAETRLNERLADPGGFGETVAGQIDYTLFDASKTASILYDGQWVTAEGNVTVAPAGSAAADVFLNNGVLTMADTADGRPPNFTIRRGSLYVKSPDSNLVAADLRGKLNIDEDRFVAVQGNVTLNNGFEFPQGSMYIKGDLKIIGDIRLSGTVYVDGKVELKEMRSINKKQSPADDPIPLIIVATGEIVLGNNTNENNDEVRAFLYSQQKMRLYGVISKLNLFGGIHGEAGVELNAVRGSDLVPTGIAPIVYAGPPWNGPTVPPGQSGMAADTSRLRILYDNNLYDKPPYGIPITNGFNVFVKDIQFIK